eukprot:SAG11_NODE_34005_length_274_cov_0.691429_1_plen_85_part_01
MTEAQCAIGCGLLERSALKISIGSAREALHRSFLLIVLTSSCAPKVGAGVMAVGAVAAVVGGAVSLPAVVVGGAAYKVCIVAPPL